MIDDARFQDTRLVFVRLMEKIDCLLSDHPEAEQAIAVQTAAGTVYSFANRNVTQGNRVDEDAFLDMLEAKGELLLRCIACKWQPGGSNVDLTSWHFRNRLTTAHPENDQALHLINCGDHLSMAPLEKLK